MNICLCLFIDASNTSHYAMFIASLAVTWWLGRCRPCVLQNCRPQGHGKRDILSVWRLTSNGFAVVGRKRSWLNWYIILTFAWMTSGKERHVASRFSGLRRSRIDCFSCRPIRVWFVQRHEADHASGVRLVTWRVVRLLCDQSVTYIT